MARKCEYCDKKVTPGNHVSQRGKPKYQGGNGRKTTGIERRAFKPNLQKIRVQEGDRVVTRKVCTRCIRNGVVQKAVSRQPFSLPAT